MAGRFPLLLDEHIPRALAQALRSRGWIVVRVVDLKTGLGLGADDEQVFTYACEHGYVVLSSDERALGARGRRGRRDRGRWPGRRRRLRHAPSATEAEIYWLKVRKKLRSSRLCAVWSGRRE
jgi:hypothetical protein